MTAEAVRRVAGVKDFYPYIKPPAEHIERLAA